MRVVEGRAPFARLGPRSTRPVCRDPAVAPGETAVPVPDTTPRHSDSDRETLEQQVRALQERLAFYEGFDRLIQDNVAHARELFRLAAQEREAASTAIDRGATRCRSAGGASSRRARADRVRSRAAFADRRGAVRSRGASAWRAGRARTAGTIPRWRRRVPSSRCRWSCTGCHRRGRRSRCSASSPRYRRSPTSRRGSSWAACSASMPACGTSSRSRSS